jgi:hypothetical protein
MNKFFNAVFGILAVAGFMLAALDFVLNRNDQAIVLALFAIQLTLWENQTQRAIERDE